MEQFDPYYEWLGISPKDQPPHHYRLLGIELWEARPIAITKGAERQTGYLRAAAPGAYSNLHEKLLGDIAAAKECLLDERARAAYNAQLRARFHQEALKEARLLAPNPPPTASRPALAAPTVRMPRPAAPRRNSQMAIKLALLGAIFLFFVVASIVGSRFFTSDQTTQFAMPELKLEPIEKQVIGLDKPLIVQPRLTHAFAWKDHVEYRFSERQPEGATIAPHSGEVRWTPTAPGNVTITIGVAPLSEDNQYDETSFDVEVRPDPPRFATLDYYAVAAGRELTVPLAIRNRDRCGSQLRYQLGTRSPAGATLDPLTGVLTWKTDAQLKPGVYPMYVEVYNAFDLGDQATFRVEVRSTNRAPRLTAPDTIHLVCDTRQQIKIEAQDPDGPATHLSFRLLEAPYWVSIAKESGMLTCTPPETEAGRSTSIVVRVTDDATPPLSDERVLSLLVQRMAYEPKVGQMTAAQIRAMLAGNKKITVSQWELVGVVLRRIGELREHSYGEAPTVHQRIVSDNKNPGSDLCSYKRGSELRFEGPVVTFRNTDFAVGEAHDGNAAGLKRYANVLNGRWHGPMGTWGNDGRKEYYGEYERGQRDGFCCLFGQGEPQLVLDCNDGKVRGAYLIVDRYVKKRFADETLARTDADLPDLLDRITAIENEWRKYDVTLRAAVQKKFNLQQGRSTGAARENIQNRVNQRGAEHQGSINNLRTVAP